MSTEPKAMTTDPRTDRRKTPTRCRNGDCGAPLTEPLGGRDYKPLKTATLTGDARPKLICKSCDHIDRRDPRGDRRDGRRAIRDAGELYGKLWKELRQVANRIDSAERSVGERINGLDGWAEDTDGQLDRMGDKLENLNARARKGFNRDAELRERVEELEKSRDPAWANLEARVGKLERSAERSAVRRQAEQRGVGPSLLELLPDGFDADELRDVALRVGRIMQRIEERLDELEPGGTTFPTETLEETLVGLALEISHELDDMGPQHVVARTLNAILSGATVLSTKAFGTPPAAEIGRLADRLFHLHQRALNIYAMHNRANDIRERHRVASDHLYSAAPTLLHSLEREAVELLQEIRAV